MIKVFLFHRVSPDADKLWAPITPHNFEEIIKYIKKSYHILNLDSIPNVNSLNLQKKQALVTFDDGYKDFIEYALPIMDKHDVPSSCFIVTDCTDRKEPPWTYVLDYVFQYSNRLEVSLDDELLPPELKLTKWADTDERLAYAKKLKLFLKKQMHEYRLQVLSGFVTEMDDAQVPHDLLMSWEEVVEIKNHGVKIGSHTHTHPLLDKINHEQTLKNELGLSKRVLEEKLNSQIDYISYPNGNYDARVVNMAKALGYKAGFAVKERGYLPDSDSIMEIPRISLFNESVLKTRLRSSGILQKIKNLVGR